MNKPLKTQKTNKILGVIITVSLLILVLNITGAMTKISRNVFGVNTYATEVNLEIVPSLSNEIAEVDSNGIVINTIYFDPPSITDVSFVGLVKSYKTKIESEFLDTYNLNSGRNDTVGIHGATLTFSLNLTIVNGETVIFQKTLQFEKGNSRTFTIYHNPEKIKQGDIITVILNIHMKLILPNPLNKVIEYDVSKQTQKTAGEDI